MILPCRHACPLCVEADPVFGRTAVPTAFSTAALLRLVSTVAPGHLMNTFKIAPLIISASQGFGIYFVLCKQNVCFPPGFFCGLSLNVTQELKGQHYLYVADKEMRHLETDIFWIQKDSVSLSAVSGLVLGLAFQTFNMVLSVYAFLIFTLRASFPI